MTTADSWKHERDLGGCRHCRGLGYLPASYSRGAIPCGCDDPAEDDASQVGTPEGVNQNPVIRQSRNTDSVIQDSRTTETPGVNHEGGEP